jgi:peptidoglycan hydrolase CwlO-like protein
MMMKERLSKIEVSVAALSAVIVFIATLTGPRLSHGVPRDRLAAAHMRQTQEIAVLEKALAAAQEEGRSLQGRFAETGLQLTGARSELAALKQERETLSTQLAASADQIRKLGEKLKAAEQEATELKELLSVQEATKQRDEAKARADKAEERIRQLTLELHRSGVWP